MLKSVRRFRIFTSRFENRDEIILRDYLALERTRLANERTLLSYIRTSLYMFLGGIAVIQMTGFIEIRWLGFLSLGFSVASLVIGVMRYFVINVRLKKYYQREQEKE